MSWEENCEGLCPIARTLAVIGDRWTLLIMRELLLGVRKFDDIQAQTGMSSNLLTGRLRRMEADGVIERRLYVDKPKRYQYFATAKGRELDPVILTMRSWGMKHGGLEPGADSAAKLVHRATGVLIDADWRMPEDGPLFSFKDVDSSVNPGWGAERAERAATFQLAKRNRSKSA